MHYLSRAVHHGKRLAKDRTPLTDDLIGRLGYHEGADVTVQAMAEFSEALREAYADECADQRAHMRANPEP